MSHINFMKPALLAAVLVSVLAASTAWALDINSAKDQGLVGERPDGYIAVVQGNAPASLAAFVQSINEKRRAKYVALAKKNGTNLQAVQQIVGEKLISTARAGHFVMRGGQWVRK